MPNLINFDYNTNVIRTQVTEDGEPLFCLADICKVLGVSDPSNTARQVAEEFSEHPVLNTDSLITIPTDTGYGIKDLIYLTEPQLYFVLMRSRSDNARPFRQWVVNDVLPSIRKTGKYEAPKPEPIVKPKDFKLADMMESAKIIFDAAGIEGAALALALDSVAVNETGKSMIKAAGLQLSVPDQKVPLCPTDIGKPLGLTPQAVNSILAARGLQRKKADGKWEPTEKGKQLGAVLLYVSKKQGTGTPVTQLKWPSDILDKSASL